MPKTNDKHLRVVFFSFGILEQGGGFEMYLISTARGLADRYKDLHISIVTMSPEIVEKLQYFLSIYFLKKQDPKSIYREPTASLKNKLESVAYKQAKSFRELAKTLNECDVIYSKNELLELSVLKYLRHSVKTPTIVGVHTSVYYSFASSLPAKLHNLIYAGPIYSWLIKEASCIDVNQTEDKHFLENRLRLRNVHVMHHAIPVVRGRQITNNSKKLRVLFAGRFTEQKGIDALAEIIRKLSEKSLLTDFEFKIAGSGESSLTDMISDLAKHSTNINYVGHIAHEGIGYLYDWTDVTLIPSRNETLSLIAIETAVAGKVAVASDIPGPREVIENGITGFLVQFDVLAFVETLRRLSALKQNDYKKLIEMGKAAQIKVAEEYDPDVVYRQMYEQLRLTALASKKVKRNSQTISDTEHA
jgi:glycosyltransferase involved in cell wall biosynthesis